MTRTTRFAAFLVLTLVLAAAFPAQAGVNISASVLWDPNPDDDSQVFLHVSSTAYPMPRDKATRVFNKLDDPYGDYPVLAFIAHTASVDIGAVWRFRKKGHDWLDVMVHFGVRPDVLFVELPRQPGPPYGKAYGYWRKQGNRVTARQVPDDDVRFWVGLHAASRYTGASPAQLIAHGPSNIRVTTARKYRAKTGKGNRMETAGVGHSKGNGRGKNKDKP
jgi:hypothetical protein